VWDRKASGFELDDGLVLAEQFGGGEMRENGSAFEVTSAISGLLTLIFQAIFEPSSAVTFCVFFVSLAGSFVYSGGVTITSLRTSAGKSKTVMVCCCRLLIGELDVVFRVALHLAMRPPKTCSSTVRRIGRRSRILPSASLTMSMASAGTGPSKRASMMRREPRSTSASPGVRMALNSVASGAARISDSRFLTSDQAY
jgi:hypothetical protein